MWAKSCSFPRFIAFRKVFPFVSSRNWNSPPRRVVFWDPFLKRHLTAGGSKKLLVIPLMSVRSGHGHGWKMESHGRGLNQMEPDARISQAAERTAERAPVIGSKVHLLCTDSGMGPPSTKGTVAPNALVICTTKGPLMAILTLPRKQ